MQLPIESPLVPVLFASDATHLNNYSGDGKVWPLYMRIGNIKSSITNKSSNLAWVPVALLPVRLKHIKKVPGGLKKNRNTSLLRSCTACLRLSYVRYRTRYRMESKSHMRIRWFGVTIFGSLQGWRTYGKFNNTLHLFHPMSHLWISCAHAWWISTTPTAQSPPECRVGAEIGQAETP